MVRPLQQAVSSPLQLVRPLLGRADRFGSLLDEAKCSREVALLASRCLSFVQGSFRTSGGQINDCFATTVSLAAKEVTRRVPIVFVAGSDPVKYGVIQSISNPRGRLTGVASFRTEITPKRFALMKEITISS